MKIKGLQNSVSEYSSMFNKDDSKADEVKIVETFRETLDVFWSNFSANKEQYTSIGIILAITGLF